MPYLFLAIAIISEVIATALLKKSDGFHQLRPALLSLACYAVAFYCMSVSLRTIPVGIAYGIWSGIGIILISTIGDVWFHQKLDMAAIAGLGLIIAGVIVATVLSKGAPT
jgi:small multidrug resistance pump